MAEILEIDGIDLRGQGFGAATRTGRYNLALRRGENLVLAGSSGSQFVANKPFEEGSGVLTLWAIGATTSSSGERVIPDTAAGRRAAFENNMQSFMRLFTRGHRLSTITSGQPDGSMRRAQVEWKEWSEPTVMAGGTRAEWAITYTIPGVWWEDVSEISVSSNVGVAASEYVLSMNAFTGMTGVIDDALLRITGPISAPKVVCAETGAFVQYLGTVPAGQVLAIDSKSGTATLNGNSVMKDVIHAGGYKLLTIQNCFGLSNTPRLLLQGVNTGGTTGLLVTAKRKWAHG